MEVVALFNAAISKIHRIESSPGPYEPFILFGPPPYDYGLVGDDETEAFERALDALLAFEKEIRTTVSRARTRELLRDFFWSVRSGPSSTEIADTDVRSFIQGLLVEPKVTWKVIRPLFGANLSSECPLEFGPCTVYNWSTHKEHLAERFPGSQNQLERLVEEHSRVDAPGVPLLITTTVASRDYRIAQEFADATLQTVEYVFRYVMSFFGGVKNPISIFQQPQEVQHLGLVVSHERVEALTQFQSRYDAIFHFGFELDLADPFFQDKKAGFDRVWRALRDGPSADEVSRRVLAAVTWVGKGITDPDPARRLVQYVFALEALLTFREDGVLVSPSIASQIAESAAFISSDEFVYRSEMESSVKWLYDIRSGIVHGGKRTVTRQDAERALNIIKRLVVRLTTHPELIHVRSPKELRDWVTQRKYGVCSDQSKT